MLNASPKLGVFGEYIPCAVLWQIVEQSSPEVYRIGVLFAELNFRRDRYSCNTVIIRRFNFCALASARKN